MGRPKQKGKIKWGRREREGVKAQTDGKENQVGKKGKESREGNYKQKGKRKEGKEKGREGKKREEMTRLRK